jgi:hypothetical protein
MKRYFAQARKTVSEVFRELGNVALKSFSEGESLHCIQNTHLHISFNYIACKYGHLVYLERKAKQNLKSETTLRVRYTLRRQLYGRKFL